MTAPKLEPLSEEELDAAEKYAHLVLDPDTAHRLIAEVRAHRAAALNDEDRELLADARDTVSDADTYFTPSKTRIIDLLDRLLRSTT